MNTPRSLPRLSFLPVSGAAARIAAGAVLIAALLPCGCDDDPPAAGIDAIDGRSATLDARGGSTDSEISFGTRIATEGIPGDGGSLRVTSAAGNVTVMNRPQSFSIDGPLSGISTLGVGLYVRSGDSIPIGGSGIVDFLYIESGGKVILTANTTIQVFGDVFIAGSICSQFSSLRRDGYDLTISAGRDPGQATMIITGTIDASGADYDDNDRTVDVPGLISPDGSYRLAGSGGEVFLACDGDIYLTGQVLSDGGRSTSHDADLALAGSGGQILIGTSGLIYSSGRTSARAGDSTANSVTIGPRGGDIQFTADGDVLLEGISSVNAAGGQSSSGKGGNGGRVILEAPIGTVTADGFDLDVSGGKINYKDGVAGDGGVVSLAGSAIGLSTMNFLAAGGDVTEEAEGDGGQGGRVTLSASNSISVGAGAAGSDVVFDAGGGTAIGEARDGGTGGEFMAIVGEAYPSVNFTRGFINVAGGPQFGGLQGSAGTVCVSSPDGFVSEANIIGTGQFPLSGCDSSAFQDFEAVVHDIGCLQTGLTPTTISTTLPAVVGRDFFRVPIPATATGVTISTAGQSDGNIDLYAGASTSLGSQVTADYSFASENPDSTESITIDATTLPTLDSFRAGGYISVYVQERNSFVEDYSITASCTE